MTMPDPVRSVLEDAERAARRQLEREVVRALTSLRTSDCPDCGARGSVRRSFCDVCLAELDESTAGAAALPPAAPVVSRSAR